MRSSYCSRVPLVDEFWVLVGYCVYTEYVMASLRYVSCTLAMFYFCSLAAVSLQTAQLPSAEKQALMEIARELGKKDGNFSLNPCDGNNNWNTSNWLQSFLICNCAFRDRVCHIEQNPKKAGPTGRASPIRGKTTPPYDPGLGQQLLDWKYPPRVGIYQTSKTVMLSGNRLSGPIPDHLGNITTLEYLIIETNRFNGGVPSELGRLVKLETLVLSANNISGRLPTELFHLKNLYLGSATIVSEGKCRVSNVLRVLEELQSSGFEGPIPSNISNLNLTQLRISDLGGGDSEFPNLGNMIGMTRLMLRSCNIYGYKSLSFNKIQGEIPDLEGLRKPQVMFLTENNLSGPLPRWIKIREPKNQIDLSYNNLQESSLPCSRDESLSLYANLIIFHVYAAKLIFLTIISKRALCHALEIHSYSEATMEKMELMLGHVCALVQKLNTCHYYSFHINCGGPTIRVGNVVYEEDQSLLGSEKFDHTRDHWGSSSTGIFWDTQTDQYVYTPENQTSLHMEDPELYTTARVSPLTLTYYGRCLANGNYTIRFAEIVFRDGQTYASLGIRMFDVYIQGERRLHNFDIAREASGVGKALTRFSASINPVEDFSYYCCFFSDSRTYFCGGDGLRIKVKLTLLDLQKGEFTYGQLAAITNNFDVVNRLGKGGNATVYKGTLLDGTIVAIKKVKNRSKIKDYQRFINEVGLITALRHPNLLRLYECCIERQDLLLVYEYMENNSLSEALYAAAH
ncbi:hypothetical protein OROMI_025253 [Orobanche minor]